MAGGLLTGKYSNDIDAGRLFYDDINHFRQRNYQQANEVLRSVADEMECTPAQVALAWVRNHNVIPIVGARTRQQIHENLGVLEVSLAVQQMEKRDQVSRIDLGYPHAYLCRTRPTTYAGMFEKIDRHRNRGAIGP